MYPTDKVIFKSIARKILPSYIRKWLLRAMNVVNEWKTSYLLYRLHRRMRLIPAGSNKTERLLHYNISIHHGGAFYALCKDVFVLRIYHFEAQRPDPFILDCGSNIGGVILYYKYVYPKARIIGFEADPVIFPYLKENINQNGLVDVQLVQAALAVEEGASDFYSDGKSGSCLAKNLSERHTTQGRTKYEVQSVCLRDYLIEPVDFLKMNIEGAEWEVLADCGERLKLVKEMVIEYHHLPGLPRTLHNILGLLHTHGFDYLINDFDKETNPGLEPPFSLTKESRYYLLIYAKRMDQEADKNDDT